MSEKQRIPEITQKLKVKGASNLFDDAVTVHINMKEDDSDVKTASGKAAKAMKSRMETDGTVASMILEPVDEAGETSGRPKLEVKITINMKQIERHHRDIETYVSPFPLRTDSIFMRIPLRPQDFDRIEKSRDRLDNLVAFCHELTPEVLPPFDSKNFLQKLRKIDVRCSALYPRPPAPGDRDKKSSRMCPQYEPEIEDIEKQIERIDGILHGAQYFHRLDIVRCMMMERKQAAEAHKLKMEQAKKQKTEQETEQENEA
ncbi:unnamed protein product [Caenorhabditis sp. 36 PRJEB53466]|nr:unnamed protein product [Caenorhabditis sp. 36 PRJEB53466]